MVEEIDWKWVEANISRDVSKLRFADTSKKHAYDILQIECIARHRRKLRDTLAHNPHFVFPNLVVAEQSTSDALARYHSTLVVGARLLDLTAGLGIDAFHFAKSRQVTAIDIDLSTIEAIKHNADVMNLPVRAIHSSAEDYIAKALPDSYDTIFIDPSRRGLNGERLYAVAQCKPNVTELLPKMLVIAPRVVIKLSPMLDLTKITKELNNVERLECIGTRRECKEVIVVCSRHYNEGIPQIEAVTLNSDGDIISRLHGSHKQATGTTPPATLPQPGLFLLEPWPAEMKSQLFRQYETHYNCQCLSQTSHLFISSTPSTDADAWLISSVHKFNKQSVKKIKAIYNGMYDVTARNFNIQSAYMAKMLGAKSYSGRRIFATTDSTNQRLLIVCEKVI